MIEIEFSHSLQTEFKRIKKIDLKLSQKIFKQLKIFQINPRHPSLRNHKLSGHLINTRSISVNMRIRLLYHLTPEGVAYFFSLGTHDEVYRK